MIRYAQNNQCWMSSLVRQFGDTADSQKAYGICDSCAPESCVAQKFRDATGQEQTVACDVVSALRMNRKSVGKLHMELCGNKGIDRGGFEELIGSMARAGLVRLVDSAFEKDGKQIPFRMVSLTGDAERVDTHMSLALRIREKAAFFVRLTAKNGRKTLGRKKRSSAAAKQKFHRAPAEAREDRGARQGSGTAAKLKAWRRAVATKQGVPASRIMSDRVLLAIAEKEPATAAELLAIPGIGNKLVEKYAAQIYRILNESRM